MTRPEQPEPNHRFKTTQTVITTTGFSFEMCIDSYQFKAMDVSSDIEKAGEEMIHFFSDCDKLFK